MDEEESKPLIEQVVRLVLFIIIAIILFVIVYRIFAAGGA